MKYSFVLLLLIGVSGSAQNSEENIPAMINSIKVLGRFPVVNTKLPYDVNGEFTPMKIIKR